MSKILLVDDEKDVLLTLGKRLVSYGYTVITADNGYDAITLAKTKFPDIVLLDIMMPGMEGGEVAQKLKDDPATKNIPVIFLTALLSKTEEYRDNHLVAGNVTLAKPIDIEVLLTQIKKFL
jgi:two-component system sensor histidine kinase/response regulator